MKTDYKAAFYQQGSRESFEKTPLVINWKLTNMCNYACSYCFGQYKLDKKRFSSWEHIQQAVRNISKLNRSSYRVTLAGGEPTVHPHFFALLSEFSTVLQDKLKGINIITNGSRNTEIYHHIAKISSKVPITLNVSLHSEFVQLRHIKELISQTSRSANLNFKCMLNHNKFKYVKEICQELIEMRKDYPFTFSITKLRVPPSFALLDPNYTQEHFNWEKEVLEQFSAIAKKNTKKSTFCNAFPCTIFYERMINSNIEILKHPSVNQQIQKGFRKFTNMYCAMGTSIMRIHPNGQCCGAVCSLSNKNSKNIFNENFSLDDDFIRLVKCSRENCGCISDLPIPKFADEAQASDFLNDFKARLGEQKKCSSANLFTFLKKSSKTLNLNWQIRKIL